MNSPEDQNIGNQEQPAETFPGTAPENKDFAWLTRKQAREILLSLVPHLGEISPDASHDQVIAMIRGTMNGEY